MTWPCDSFQLYPRSEPIQPFVAGVHNWQSVFSAAVDESNSHTDNTIKQRKADELTSMLASCLFKYLANIVLLCS